MGLTWAGVQDGCHDPDRLSVGVLDALRGMGLGPRVEDETGGWRGWGRSLGREGVGGWSVTPAPLVFRS